MKPGEQLVLVIFGNLNIFTFKSILELFVHSKSKIQLFLSCMTPLPQFYCVAVDSSLAQPVLPPVALGPAQHSRLSHQQWHQKHWQHCLQFRPLQCGTLFSLDHVFVHKNLNHGQIIVVPCSIAHRLQSFTLVPRTVRLQLVQEWFDQVALNLGKIWSTRARFCC